MLDDDFVVCGWIPKQNNMTSVIIGKYNAENDLVYKGDVTLGVGSTNFSQIKTCEVSRPPFNSIHKGNENAIWINPQLVCTVQFMEYTASGDMCQPVFKGLRIDKTASEIFE